MIAYSPCSGHRDCERQGVHRTPVAGEIRQGALAHHASISDHCDHQGSEINAKNGNSMGNPVAGMLEGKNLEPEHVEQKADV
jgi:hypothetical protein